MTKLWALIERKYWAGSRQFRRRRHEQFCQIVGQPRLVLDVGGTPAYHDDHPFPGSPRVTLLNPAARDDWATDSIEPVCAPADVLQSFASGSVDLVFSNSTLAYVGDRTKRAVIAAEIQRVGRAYFVQTPNQLFPVDWRTLVPFFHWLPFKAQAWFFSRMRVGKHPRLSPDYALEFAMQAQDVTHSELRQLFPDATIKRERLLGLTKSFVVYGGQLPC